MLKRKACDSISEWKRTKTTQALLITDARQVGKTTAVREFATHAYDVLAEINFLDNKTAQETVSHATDADDLSLRLSVLSEKELVPDRTRLS